MRVTRCRTRPLGEWQCIGIIYGIGRAPHARLPGVRAGLAAAARLLFAANAPPLSAPEVPIMTSAISQSEPSAERKRSASCMLSAKIEDARPAVTTLCSAMTRQNSEYFIMYRIGANVSLSTGPDCLRMSTIAASHNRRYPCRHRRHGRPRSPNRLRRSERLLHVFERLLIDQRTGEGRRFQGVAYRDALVGLGAEPAYRRHSLARTGGAASCSAVRPYPWPRTLAR